MHFARLRPFLGTGILLVCGFNLACDELANSVLDPSNSLLQSSGNSDPNSPGTVPQSGDPSVISGGTLSGGGSSSGGSSAGSPGADPGSSSSSNNGGGGQNGGGTQTVVTVDTRPVTMVTTLDDYDWLETPIEGSLRWAVDNAPTPGVIRFAVGGPIDLKRTMPVKRSDLEIDGSTAPNGGITFQQRQFEVRDTHDVVLRNLRFRSGDGFRDDAERVAAHGQYFDLFAPDFSGGQRSLVVVGEHGPCRRVRIENCSIQNSTDDNCSVWNDCAEIVFFRCVFSGGYAHLPKALLCGADPGTPPPSHPNWVTVQQCLFINEWARMPDMEGDTVHLINNVLVRPMQGGRLYTTKANVVGNCLFSVPNHPWYANADHVLVTVPGTATNDSLYLNGNLLDGLFQDATKIVGIMNQGQTPLPQSVFRNQPQPGLPANVISAPQALVEVLTNAGCRGPGRDAIDLTQIDQAAVAVGINPSTVR